VREAIVAACSFDFGQCGVGEFGHAAVEIFATAVCCPPRTTAGGTMNSVNIKRSIVRNGRKTSVSLEKEFWEGLREIASAQNVKLATLVRQIDQGRKGTNLSSAIRVFVFNRLRGRPADEQPTKPARRDPSGSVFEAAAAGF